MVKTYMHRDDSPVFTTTHWYPLDIAKRFDKVKPVRYADEDNYTTADLRKSELIENLILGYPQPVLPVILQSNGEYIFFKGYNEMVAISDFIHNDYPLTDLKEIDILNGKYYADLTGYAKEMVDYSTPITVNLLARHMLDEQYDSIYWRLKH